MVALAQQASPMKMAKSINFIILIFGAKMKANGLCLCVAKSVQMESERLLIWWLGMLGKVLRLTDMKAKQILVLIR